MILCGDVPDDPVGEEGVKGEGGGKGFASLVPGRGWGEGRGLHL